jgi:hypothetical protein
LKLDFAPIDLTWRASKGRILGGVFDEQGDLENVSDIFLRGE